MTTFDQVEQALPNGFHDAFLRSVSVDYVERTAQMELEVWVSSMDTDNRQHREDYRRGRLQFIDLFLFSVEVPDQEFLSSTTNGLSIDVTPAGYEAFPKQGWPEEPLPEGAFLRSFCFTNEANSFVYVAAQEAAWMWLTEPRIIY